MQLSLIQTDILIPNECLLNLDIKEWKVYKLLKVPIAPVKPILYAETQIDIVWKGEYI